MEEKFKIQINDEEIILRSLRPTDSIPGITDLLHKSYKRLADLGFRYMATHQDDSETKKRLTSGHSYVALKDKEIISTVTLYYNNLNNHNAAWYNKAGVAHFGQFAVIPEFQGKGLGNEMMNIVETKAGKLGALELALDTAEGADHLIRYYKKRGYRFIEYVNWNVTNYRSVIMSKKL